MSNVVPRQTKISHDHNFQLEGDYHLIHTLLKNNPLYEIPKHLRGKILGHCSDTLASAEASVSEKTMAARVVLECDKRNIDIVKMAMPKHVVHHNAEDLTDEELKAELQRLVDQGALAPTLTGGVLDAITAGEP
jgi:hypothetical protein